SRTRSRPGSRRWPCWRPSRRSWAWECWGGRSSTCSGHGGRGDARAGESIADWRRIKRQLAPARAPPVIDPHEEEEESIEGLLAGIAGRDHDLLSVGCDRIRIAQPHRPVGQPPITDANRPIAPTHASLVLFHEQERVPSVEPPR